MLKEFLRSTIPPLKLLRVRGQALVFFALLIPLLLLFAGVGLDLGWYYLNVSRLQNAADAAAVAGARALAEDFNSKASPTVSMATSTTKTYSYARLVDKYPGDKPYEPTSTTEITAENKVAGDDVAGQYVTKNLGENRSVPVRNAEGNLLDSEGNPIINSAGYKTQKDEAGNWVVTDSYGNEVNGVTLSTEKIIADNWSKGGDPKVTPTYSLYQDEDKFYYVVKLTENITHFFLPGWFPVPMEAPVVAVALISQNTSIEQIMEAFEKLKNENVIVGNWEVQNFYKSMELAYKRDKDGNFVDVDGNPVTKDKDKVAVYATDINGNYILDSNGNKVQDYTHVYANSIAYTERFKANIYAGAWNHFQDFFNHFWATGYHDPSTPDDLMLIAGDFYRREIITVRDDVNAASDRLYGSNSSVAATTASINKKPGHVNNPQQPSDTKKTYAKYKDKDGNLKDIDDRGAVGLPYKWEYLDSINVDFKPEVTLPDKWIGKDWDVSLEDNSGVSFNYTNWAKPEQSGNVVITDKYIKHMRIHANINFDEPYKERSDLEPPRDPYKEELREKDAAGNLLPDILWGRIESEPMLFYPDALNGYETHMGKKQTALSSVRQIIINVNSSNYNTGSVTYRPVILFYDGPERYSTEDPTRESRPVILNLGKPFRGVLFAPNSPVVITGNAQNQFQGFVMAKKYMRLKNDDDFVFGGYRYFNSKDKQWEYFRSVDANGKVTYKDVDGNLKTNRFDSNTYKVAYYYAKDDNKAEKTKYYRTVENKTIIDNGVEKETGNEIVLYTDEYGEVQFADLNLSVNDPDRKIGEFELFGRTDFTTHDADLGILERISKDNGGINMFDPEILAKLLG